MIQKSQTNRGGVSYGNFEHHENFVISGKEQVEMFVNAIEESAKNRPVPISVAANEITDEAELVELMTKWEKANVGNK